MLFLTLLKYFKRIFATLAGDLLDSVKLAYYNIFTAYFKYNALKILYNIQETSTWMDMSSNISVQKYPDSHLCVSATCRMVTTTDT